MQKCKFRGCNYEHKQLCSIKQHEKIHSSDPKGLLPHVCHYCGYRASSKYRLKNHIILHTEGKKFNCSIFGCDYRTHNKVNLRLHEKGHSLVQICCDFEGCSYKSKYRSRLKAHNASHYDGEREKSIECPMCGKTFGKFTLMKSHLRSHTNEKPWRCSVCSYECKLQTTLNKHLEAIHGLHSRSREQLFKKCEFCDFTSTFKNKFTRHVASHSEERPFPCTFPGCSYRAKRKDSLKTHATTHRPEVHQCPEPGCSHVAKSRGLYVAHLRMHNKPFKCLFPNCERKFPKEASLHYHQKLHDPNRQFLCEHCPERFAMKHVLAKHIRTVHTKDREFRCSHCDFCTGFRPNLKLHLKKVHFDHLEEHRMKVHKQSALEYIPASVRKWCDCEVHGAISKSECKLTKNTKILHRVATVILSRIAVQDL